MREIIKMIVVLTVLSCFSGGLLAAIRGGTKDRIENQQLEFVKGPAIRTILDGCSNDPIADRFKIKDGDIERSFFVGVFDGKANSVAFESFGGGFGGDIGLMVGVNIENDKIINIGVTTHSETPGVGSRAKSEPKLSNRFIGLGLIKTFKVKTDGGEIDAISGATVTSRGVCAGVTEAGNVYNRLKSQVIEKIKTFS